MFKHYQQLKVIFVTALAYTIQIIVLSLLFIGLFTLGFSWVGVLTSLMIYLLSTWLVSSMTSKKCPYCDSSISDKAIKCPKCQSDISK